MCRFVTSQARGGKAVTYLFDPNVSLNLSNRLGLAFEESQQFLEATTSLEAALLAFKPSTLRMMGGTASARRLPRVRDETCDASPFMTRCMICCAFAVGLGFRDEARVMVPDGVELFFERFGWD